MIPQVSPEIPEENAHFPKGAAQGAAVGAENAPIDPDLQTIIERWPDLPQKVKDGLMAIVKNG